MKTLINITKELIGIEKVNSVYARELHKTLEIKKQFSDWITHQIKPLGLEENMDYIIYTKKVEKGRSLKEYIITQDRAKHISMASRTVKGKEVRNYFIEIEKSSNDDTKIKSLNGRIGGLTTTNNMYKNKIELLENQLKTKSSYHMSTNTISL